MKLIANLSMMFTEHALVDRIAAAQEAGFEGVEIQFPPAHKIKMIAEASSAHSMPITLINIPKGPADAVGLAALPGEEHRFHKAVDQCALDARALGVRKVNLLAGRPPENADLNQCRATLIDNLRIAADKMAQIGVRLMLEPINRLDVPGFFVSGVDDGLSIIEEASHPNLAMQFDLYHMAITEPNLDAAICKAGDKIGHVQFADTPGRHEPGSGIVNFKSALQTLKETGYDDVISAEYNPAEKTEAGLGWMNDFREWMDD